MSSLVLGLGLAVLASVALNSCYVIQHVGSASAPPVDIRRPIATLRGLLSSRAWLIGGVLGMTGWGLHIVALSHAPLSLVQAFVAGGLGLMAPIASRVLGEPLAPVERVAVGAVVAGLALLCVGLGDPGVHGHVRAVRLSLFLAGSGAIAVVFAVLRVEWRARALGLAGGMLYGTADVAIKAMTGVASAHGVASALLSPWLVAAAVATAGAFFSFQRALQSGEAVPAIVLMTAATTVLSVLGGFVVFGDPLGSTTGLAALHLAAFALVAAAAAALAPTLASRPGDAADRPEAAPADGRAAPASAI
ncbi:MAG: hypothetical protein JOZ25_10955 [Actinobacteria bacterium]|nr:hypothetical protein [Actinomycetota bacterium]